jgi:hypothetical protein
MAVHAGSSFAAAAAAYFAKHCDPARYFVHLLFMQQRLFVRVGCSCRTPLWPQALQKPSALSAIVMRPIGNQPKRIQHLCTAYL